jgi:hypothetical protein
MKWEEILKNIQISSQKTSSKNYVKPDENEECLRKLLNLSNEYLKLPRVINWRRYLDTYWDTGDLVVSDFQDPIMHETWPSEYGISEEVLCWWVKNLKLPENKLPNNRPDNYTGFASRKDGENMAFFYADFFEFKSRGKKCVRIKIRLIYKNAGHFYSTFNITGPSYKEVRDFMTEAVS